MHGLDAARIVELSERGAGLGPSSRAALLLAAAFPQADRTELCGVPLGTRDRLLMRLRAQAFGHELCAHQRCAVCGEDYELTLTADSIGLSPKPEDESLPPAPAGELAAGGRSYVVHAIRAGDMIAAEAAGSREAARALLAARAVPDAPAGSIDAERLGEVLEALDPAADVALDVACPHCGASNDLRFDAADFVWRELAAAAPRILRDVADLARAYHWSEREILAMPASRRAFYLAAAAA